MLLVGDGRDDDVPAQPERGRLAAGDERGGDAGLHVVGAAAVAAAALHARLVRGLHALDADGVDVPAQQQRAPAARARRPHDDARAPRRRFEHPRLEVRGERPALDERRDLALAGAAGGERGVDGVDRDELAQEVGQAHAQRPSARRMNGPSVAENAGVMCVSSRCTSAPPTTG